LDIDEMFNMLGRNDSTSSMATVSTTASARRSRLVMEFGFSCRGLPNPGRVRKPSTFLKLHGELAGGDRVYLGRTETVFDESDPVYVTKGRVPCPNASHRENKIIVTLHEESDDRHHLFGSWAGCSFRIKDIVRSPKHTLDISLTASDKTAKRTLVSMGQLVVVGDLLHSGSKTKKVQFKVVVAGSKFKRIVLHFDRLTDGGWTRTMTTKKMISTDKMNYGIRVEVPVNDLNGGEPEKVFRLALSEVKSNGSLRPIGFLENCTANLASARDGTELWLFRGDTETQGAAKCVWLVKNRLSKSGGKGKLQILINLAKLDED